MNVCDRRTPWSLLETMPLCASPGAIATNRAALSFWSSRRSPAWVGRSPNAWPVTYQPSKSSRSKLASTRSFAAADEAAERLVGWVGVSKAASCSCAGSGG